MLLDNEDFDGWLATHGKPKGVFLTGAGYLVIMFNFNPLILWLIFLLETKGDEDENVPSMEALEISSSAKNPIQSIPSYFGGEEEEDIPDMADFEDPNNLIETDPVSFYSLHHCSSLVRLLKTPVIVFLLDTGNTSVHLSCGS